MLKNLFLYFIFVFYVLSYAFALEEEKTKAIIDADEVYYEKKNKILVAKGNVEVFKNNYQINANEIRYDKESDVVEAIGNVKIIDPTGEEYFANKAEIYRELKEAIIYDLSTRLKNKMNFAATEAKYFEDSKLTKMRKVSFTTCPICKGEKPQWQFNSGRIKYDEQSETVYHTNSFFQLYGVPVMYTPYISHLAPNAKPRSGFLIPGYNYRTIYGNGGVIRYYYRISESSDLLYSPIITQKQGIVHQGEYRALFNSSDLSLKGSYNKQNRSDASSVIYPSNRYIYDLQYNHQINDDWKFNSKLNRVSDQGYLYQYHNIIQDYLTSNASVLYNHNRDYGGAKILYFQGISANVSQTKPYALPLIDIHKEFNKEKNNFILDGNILSLHREMGVDTKRAIMEGTWNRSSFFNNGIEWYNRASFRGDFYYYNNRNQATSYDVQSANANNYQKRTIPTYESEVKYPLLSSALNHVSIVQPIMQFIVVPNYATNNNIVNEDSLNVEINDGNLFSINRYSGYDRFEDGARVNYGLIGTTSSLSNQLIQYYYMIGQSYRFQNNHNFGVNSGMYNNLSDIVGHLGVKPLKFFEAYYRYRFDQKEKTLRRNEVDAYIYASKLTLNSKYVKYNYASITDSNTVIESVQLNPKLNINSFWSVEGSMQRNANKVKHFLVSSGMGLVYDGPCLWFKFSVNKDHTVNSQKALKPSTTFKFDFDLKGLM